CIEYLRADRPEILYNCFTASANNDALTQILNFLGSIFCFFYDAFAGIFGFNSFAYALGYGQNIYCNGKSIIRLVEPNGMKVGGGSRVQQLAFHDNWTNSGSQDYTYGQKYDYTTTNI